MLTLAERVVALCGSKSRIEMVPHSRTFPDGGFEDMRRRVPSIEKIWGTIGWRPQINLDEILRAVIAEKRVSLGL